MNFSFRVAEKSPGPQFGLALLRWSLVVIFLRFGPLKFTAAEAQGNEGLISHSPILSWLIGAFGVQGASNVLGTIETFTGFLLIAGAFVSIASALSAAMSSFTYLLTLSLFLSTPDLNKFVPGGAPIGLFLIKDVVLLAASVCLLQASLVRNDPRTTV